ncbi:MAG: hypothetical protein ABMA01_19250 [Chthoniobacteraceae bacterium]
MKPNELDALIEDCLEDRLSEPDAARLSALLEQSAEARARYWETASIHGLLEHTMQGASLRVVTGQALPTIPRINRWFAWRPLTAMAAGIMFGMLCTSVVFGFVVQRGVEKRTRIAVFEPGFENPQMPLANGFPTGTGRWSGDAARVVAAENGVLAKEGKFMLRLEPLSRGVPRIYQVLDLQSLPPDAGGESREIEVSASFATAGAEASVRYVIRAFGVTEAPESLDAAWFDRREESIASATKGLDVTPGVTGWQTVSVKIQVPRAARSLVLFFGTRTPDKAARTVPHYLDDVHVSLITPPLP